MIVYVMSVPAEAAAGPALTMARSAFVVTVVATVDELFPLFESVVALEMFAVFESVVPAAVAELTFAVMVNVAVAPLLNVPMEQVTVPFDPIAGLVQENAGPVFCASLTNVSPAGSASVNATVVAVDRPLFATVML